MANAQKQNWRWQKADARWRKKVVWVSENKDQKAIIKAEIRRDELSITLNRVWRSMYEKGYDPTNPELSFERLSHEWQIIEDVTKQLETLSRRVKRLEKKTGLDADELLKSHNTANVKSICF